jgi:Flp pilus assembly protein TadG
MRTCSFTRFRNRHRQSRGGAHAVEFALILIPLLMLTLGIIDWGYLFFVRHTMYHAARESARAMAVQERNETDGEDIARQWLERIIPTTDAFDIEIGDLSDPEVAVSITIPMDEARLLNFLPVPDSEMAAVVFMRHEGP